MIKTLREVVDYVAGITFKPTDKVAVGAAGAVVCMRTANIQEVLDTSDLIAVPEGLVRRDDQFLRAGDTLISSANSANLVGKCSYVPQLPFKAAAGGFIAIVRPRPDVLNAAYFYRWLNSPRTQHEVRQCARQTTNIANLSREQFLDLAMPIPPLRAQERLAGTFQRAETVLKRSDDSRVLMDKLEWSTFDELFGDPITNPRRWSEGELGHHVADVKYGTSTKCHAIAAPGSWAVLRIPNVTQQAVSTEDLKYATLSERERATLSLREGDLLFVRTNGNPDYIGRCAIIDRPYPDTAFASYLIRVRLKPEARLLPDFVAALVSLPSYRSLIERESRTTAGNYNISAAGLRQLRMIEPPLELQRRFVEIAKAARRVKQKMGESSKIATRLLASIGEQVFSE